MRTKTLLQLVLPLTFLSASAASAQTTPVSPEPAAENAPTNVPIVAKQPQADKEVPTEAPAGDPSASPQPQNSAPALPTQNGDGAETHRAPVEPPIIIPSAPKSGLGMTEYTEIVIPSAPQIIDETIEDLGKLQLNPSQSQKTKRIFLERERQRATPYLAPPSAQTRSVILDFSPGTQPPEVHLARGFQTSLVFMDSSGNPWMIEHVQMNRQMFSDGSTQPTGNIISIEPQTAVAYGNATIKLKGKSVPVIVMLNAGDRATKGRKVDVRVDIRIPGHNPDLPEGTIVDSGMLPGDTNMLRFLDGDVPPDAIRMSASNGAWIDAWRWRGHLYVRTKDIVMWPAYDAASKSGGDDGVYVYRFHEEVDSDDVLGKDSFALTFKSGAFGDVRTVFLSPRLHKAIHGEDVNTD